MSQPPRLAVAIVQPQADVRPAAWALLEALRSEGLQVQTFLTRAVFDDHLVPVAATGLSPRHLDSWLMSETQCCEVFLRGGQTCDFAVVLGAFSSQTARRAVGGRLEPLCRWLSLPALAVVDARLLDREPLPERPEDAEGVFLDRVASPEEYAELAALIRLRWGLPVLGAMGEVDGLRRALRAITPSGRPPVGLFRDLRRELLRWTNLVALRALAARPPLAMPEPTLFPTDVASDSEALIAVAYDEVFNGYFPDLLDALEWRGARIVDFSPLHDDRLPRGADLVLLGCGHPERQAEALTGNDCMRLELRNHLRRGKRIYAEGGGLAYLSHRLVLPDGDEHRMTGLFPLVAHLREAESPAMPVEVTLNRTTWLGEFGTRIRGYLDASWWMEPAGGHCNCVAQQERRHDLVQVSQAIGSQIHIHFASRGDLLTNFFHPRRSRCEALDPWLTLL